MGKQTSLHPRMIISMEIRETTNKLDIEGGRRRAKKFEKNEERMMIVYFS